MLVLVISACKKDQAQSPAANTDFEVYKTQYLEGLWKLNPDWAGSLGYHKYDSLLYVPNGGHLSNIISFDKSQLSLLGEIEIDKLAPADQIDYRLIKSQLNESQWEIDSLKAYQWDPSQYNVCGNFAFILTEHYAPLAKRLKNFYEKMATVPAYYDEAKKQIKNPVVELTNLAIDQHLGGVSVFEADFADSLKKANIPAAMQKQMLARAKASAAAVRDFAQWLKDLKNPTPRSFRLGKQLYEQKFAYNIMSQYSARQIFDSAQVRKKYLHREMFKLSKQLWPKYFGKTPIPADTLLVIRRVIDTASVNHAKPEDFQSAIEQILPQLTAFVNDKQLLTLDPSKPLLVRKEPGYMAGVAGASCSSPGPYDKDGNTYFNVGSLAGWTPERAESYLREYNHYMIQILCIHEAIPGHYVQLLYANKSPDLIKSVLGNGAMIEGWAVYGEQMMLDAGFGNNEPEMRLMWYKWNLRSVCNTIVDYSVHTGDMSRDEVVKMLTREAFQQQAEAENKWKRVSVTSVQLCSYYTGYKEITDLRQAWKKKTGADYKLKDFNEKFLSYGSAPVKYIKELMMK